MALFLIYKVVHYLNEFWNLFLDKVYLENERYHFPEEKYASFNVIS